MRYIESTGLKPDDKPVPVDTTDSHPTSEFEDEMISLHGARDDSVKPMSMIRRTIAARLERGHQPDRYPRPGDDRPPSCLRLAQRRSWRLDAEEWPADHAEDDGRPMGGVGHRPGFQTHSESDYFQQWS